MESLQDPDLNVRRATLTFFNSAVHNKPSLVRDLLDDILPLLYQETKIRRDLIREVWGSMDTWRGLALVSRPLEPPAPCWQGSRKTRSQAHTDSRAAWPQ